MASDALFLTDILDRALLGELCDVAFCLLHAGVQVICRSDAVLLQEFQPHLIDFGFHDLLPKMWRHTRWILAFFDAAKQIAVMVVQRKKSLIFGMRVIWLRLRTRDECRSGTSFDLCEIARNGALDVFFRERCVLALWMHETLLTAQPEAQPIAVMDLVALMLHEQEKVTEIVRVRNGVAQVRFQHGAERRLSFGLPQPFNIADCLGGLTFHNDGQPMLPAELI